MAAHIASTGKAQVRALLGLLNTAVEEAIAEYDKQGLDIPVIDSVYAHPMDGRLPTLKFKHAIRTLEAACGQICTTLAQPSHTMLNYSMDAFVPAAMNAAIKAGIAQLLAKHPNGLHVNELAKETSIHPQKLGTLMRLLVTNHCFQEVSSNVFANNRLSLTMLPDNASKACYILELKSGEMHRKATMWLYEALTDPEFGPTYNATRSPLMYALNKEGYSGTLYEYLNTQPGVVESFANAMVGYRSATGHLNLLNVFPWGTLPPNTSVCDLGSGNGNISIEISKHFPHLKITLQDLPETIREAQKFWQTEHPEAVNEGRVTFTPLDFFKESPAPGQDIYYLSQIFHNWGDEHSLTLLKNIRRVMVPGSRMLIDDYLAVHLDPASVEKQHASMARAPRPLSPGFGHGQIRTYTQDFCMLIMCNARERSLEDFIELCAAADLKFVRVWDLAETCLTEFVAA
ncbi:O-methyltransferase COMT-type [Pleurotus pulmonarius]